MTTEEEFYDNIVDTLNQLEAKLPKGSHVVLTGLADGRILWDTLYDRFHPLGEHGKDVTYADIYEWLLCLDLSPCKGWVSARNKS